MSTTTASPHTLSSLSPATNSYNPVESEHTKSTSPKEKESIHSSDTKNNLNLQDNPSKTEERTSGKTVEKTEIKALPSQEVERMDKEATHDSKNLPSSQDGSLEKEVSTNYLSSLHDGEHKPLPSPKDDNFNAQLHSSEGITSEEKNEKPLRNDSDSDSDDSTDSSEESASPEVAKLPNRKMSGNASPQALRAVYKPSAKTSDGQPAKALSSSDLRKPAIPEVKKLGHNLAARRSPGSPCDERTAFKKITPISPPPSPGRTVKLSPRQSPSPSPPSPTSSPSLPTSALASSGSVSARTSPTKRAVQEAIVSGGRSRAAQTQPETSDASEQGVVRGRTRSASFYSAPPPTPDFVRGRTATIAPTNGNEKVISKRFKVGSSETMGRRKAMEDVILLHGTFRKNDKQDLYAVFDGHNGRETAVYAAELLPNTLENKLQENEGNIEEGLIQAFLQMQKQVEEKELKAGSTACVALIVDEKLYIANVGDTRAVLCRGGKPLRLSVDHRTDLETERTRIEELGGTIANNRVCGILSVTRALGDTPLHPYVSSMPNVTCTSLDPATDKFLVMGCDGVFDVFPDEVVIEVINNELSRSCSSPEKAAEKLRDRAYTGGSNDNISIVVIDLRGLGS